MSYLPVVQIRKLDGGISLYEVTIDGVPVPGIRALHFDIEVHDRPRLTLELLPSEVCVIDSEAEVLAKAVELEALASEDGLVDVTTVGQSTKRWAINPRRNVEAEIAAAYEDESAEIET